MSISLTSALETAESLFSEALGKKVELHLLRSPDSDSYVTRFIGDFNYRTPAERSVDDAWERFKP